MDDFEFSLRLAHGPAPHQIISADATIVKHSVGNLTLLTQPLNSSASHGSFAEKKAKLQSPKYGSLLVLNREVTAHDEWHEDAIEARAADMFALAQSAWPIPADITLSSTEA